jgi:hypothetical protein
MSLTIQRNNIAHGGDILADLEVIRKDSERNNTTYSKFFQPFKHFYGVDFSEALVMIEEGNAEEIIRTYNEGS